MDIDLDGNASPLPHKTFALAGVIAFLIVGLIVGLAFFGPTEPVGSRDGGWYETTSTSGPSHTTEPEPTTTEPHVTSAPTTPPAPTTSEVIVTDTIPPATAAPPSPTPTPPTSVEITCVAPAVRVGNGCLLPQPEPPATRAPTTTRPAALPPTR